MSTPATVDHWQPARREIVAAVAVLLALAAVAAFAIWGMPPSATVGSPSQVQPTTTTVQIAPPEREDERGDD